MTTTRKAIIQRNRPGGRPNVAEVTAYLPRNYQVTANTDTTITIEGTDDAGWTLDGYVIPRLASGLIRADEWSQPAEWAEWAAEFWATRPYSTAAYRGDWPLDRALLAWICYASIEVPTGSYPAFRQVVRDAWPSAEAWDAMQDGGA